MSYMFHLHEEFLTNQSPTCVSYRGVWHVEDHNLYSRYFDHLGAAKTWYTVGARHAASFEKVVVDGVYVAPDYPPITTEELYTLLIDKAVMFSPRLLMAGGGGCGSRCIAAQRIRDHFPKSVPHRVQQWIQLRRGRELCHPRLVPGGFLSSPALLRPLTPSHHHLRCQPLQRDGGGDSSDGVATPISLQRFAL